MCDIVVVQNFRLETMKEIIRLRLVVDYICIYISAACCLQVEFLFVVVHLHHLFDDLPVQLLGQVLAENLKKKLVNKYLKPNSNI